MHFVIRRFMIPSQVRVRGRGRTARFVIGFQSTRKVSSRIKSVAALI
jgi:hypothetical protein